MIPLVFETDRCELRPVTPDDTTELHRLWTSPGVRRFLWDDEIIPLERAAEAVSTSLELFEQHRFGLWAARLKGIDGDLRLHRHLAVSRPSGIRATVRRGRAAVGAGLRR